MENTSIVKIKKFIEEHFTENIRLQEIAEKVGYSKYHMNRMFAKSTGKTIHNYIKERRLFEAAELLSNTDDSIVDIALQVGYTSQQAFTKAFKQQFDCTPQVYRNTNIRCIYTEKIMVSEKRRENRTIRYGEMCA